MRHKWIAGVLMTLMTACNAAQGPEVAEASAPSLVAMASPRCPAQEFNRFLEVFVDSIEVQRAFTVLPLQSDSVDAEAEPEPRVVTKMLSDSELQFPVIPSTQQQLQQALAMSSHVSGRDMVVKLTKPDSDYQMSYYFRHDACWMLYRKSDESI